MSKSRSGESADGAQNPERTGLDVWVLATAPGREDVTLHGASIITAAGLGEAFDRLRPDLVARLRERVVGEAK